MSGTRTPGQRAGLTREAVLAAARDVLAKYGLDGLTMRAIARHLGVAPNAIYSHVPSKTALVDDLLDDVLGAVDTPADRRDPTAGLHRIMASTYAVLVDHPDLVPLYLAHQGSRGPNARRLGEIMLDLLGVAGRTGRSAQEAVRVLIVYTIGFAALATGATIAPDAERPLSAGEIADNFATGLDWLLAGITGPPHRPAG